MTEALQRSEMALGQEPAEVELSIVMPCLNESETLETCIVKARTFLEAHAIAGEIIIADNGSTDGSIAIAERLGARVVHVPIRGYGAALYYGISAARGRYAIMGDSDDSYDFSALMPLVTKLREGYDLVMGNRFRGGIKPGAMPWKNRWIGNPILTAIGRLFFDSPVRDFHCGLRGFSLSAFKQLDLRTTGMEFASEMVIKATLKKRKITEVPIVLSPDGRSRPPHLRPWRDGWRHLRFMLLYSPRWLFLYPGLLLIGVGSLLGARLVYAPLTIGGVGLDVHSLVFASAAIVTGFQAVSFAISSKVFAVAEGLVPEDERLNRLFKYVTLEVGVAFGGLLLLAGFLGALRAVSTWNASNFGELEPRQVLRIVIPSALALTLGFQAVFSSFFLSVLGLRLRRSAPP
jgi:glycosyltransferase involved in cell wall biosynthesis